MLLKVYIFDLQAKALPQMPHLLGLTPVIKKLFIVQSIQVLENSIKLITCMNSDVSFYIPFE